MHAALRPFRAQGTDLDMRTASPAKSEHGGTPDNAHAMRNGLRTPDIDIVADSADDQQAMDVGSLPGMAGYAESFDGSEYPAIGNVC